MNYTFSDKISALQSSAISEILKSTNSPGIIPFAAGNPAPDAFPVDAIRAISKQIFEERPVEALQYGMTDGYAPLISAVRNQLLNEKKIGCEDDELVITNGAQQVMDLTTKILCNEGDVVVAETPSFVGALNCFKAYNIRLRGIGCESDGINVDELEAVLKEEKRARFLYVIPNFQNPLGVTMSLEKRKAVYALACKYNIIILEDNPYGDTRVAGEDIPSIKSMDTEGRVIYSGSFSKIMAPGIRVGYAWANKALIAKMVTGKQISDVHTSMFSQMLVEQWLREYDIPTHLERMRSIYRVRLNYMCDRIENEMSDTVKFVRPDGGLFVWCQLKENIKMLDFTKNCAARGVGVVPGNAFSVNDDDKFNAVRLNFTTPTMQDMEKGLTILAELAAEMNK